MPVYAVRSFWGLLRVGGPRLRNLRAGLPYLDIGPELYLAYGLKARP